MSTRGYLIFKLKGKYYTIYNHYDSYYSGMGRALVEQIVAWMSRFHGSSRKLQEFLTHRVENLKKSEENDILGPDDHPLNTNAFTNLDEKLSDTIHTLGLEVSSKLPPGCITIEYAYIIDIDSKIFSSDNCTTKFTFSWHDISVVGADVWLDAVETSDVTNLNQVFAMATIVTIQTVIRGFLERRRALCPPNGLAYLLAKKRFESASSST